MCPLFLKNSGGGRIVIFLDLTVAFGIYSPLAFGNSLCPLPLETSILEG